MKKKFRFDTEKSEEELVKEFKTFLKVETKPSYNWRDIKTFSDACLAYGTTEEKFNTKYGNIGLSKDTIAYEKIKIVVYVINGDWTPDYSDSSQLKWTPIFNLSSGCRFHTSFDLYSYSCTVAGVRLCFESKEKSNFAGKTFEPLYADLLT